MTKVSTDSEWPSSTLNKCTSAALAKTLSGEKQGYLVSTEIYDVLNVLLKCDDERGTGDTQLFCQLFSGEECSFRFATQQTREIAEDTPFCILGTTQLEVAAKLIACVNHGSGLLDRMILVSPPCLRPMANETIQARELLRQGPTSSFPEIFLILKQTLQEAPTIYRFHADASDLLMHISDEFIRELNQAILTGDDIPRSKSVDLIQRVSVALHIFNHVVSQVLMRVQPTQPPLEISLQTLRRAVKYVEWANSQKEIIVEVSLFCSFGVCSVAEPVWCNHV